ncbi:hypothetical protein J6590_041160 [Homalodisca vitripennis]|nr:hypothetical protein J6590_041160 [Homalodisca vitripennis]
MTKWLQYLCPSRSCGSRSPIFPSHGGRWERNQRSASVLVRKPYGKLMRPAVLLVAGIGRAASYRTDNINKRRLQGSGPPTLSGFVGGALHLLTEGMLAVNHHSGVLGSRLDPQLDVTHLQGKHGGNSPLRKDHEPASTEDSGHNQTELECRLFNISRCDQRSNVVGIANEETIVWHLESQQAAIRNISEIGPKNRILCSSGSDGDSPLTFGSIIQQDAICQVGYLPSRVRNTICKTRIEQVHENSWIYLRNDLPQRVGYQGRALFCPERSDSGDKLLFPKSLESTNLNSRTGRWDRLSIPWKTEGGNAAPVEDMKSRPGSHLQDVAARDFVSEESHSTALALKSPQQRHCLKIC